MIAAVVPAAGRSARLGQPKLLVNVGGETLIHRVVAALRQGGVERVIVVAPPADAPEGPPVAAEARRAGAEVLIPVTRPIEMRQSVELGLKFLKQNQPPQLVLLTPGDAPGITQDLVARLLDLAARRPARLVAPSYQGRRGHPIVLTWDLAAQIPGLPADAGVNALVNSQGDQVVELAVNDPDVLADLDTPDELNRWNRQRAQRDRSAGSCATPKAEDDGDANSAPGTLDQASGPMDTIHVTVRLFALARERVGRSEVGLELPAPAAVADLRAALRDRFPELGPLWSCAMIAVDEEYAGDGVAIAGSSQVALIPPVSGGAGVGAIRRPARDSWSSAGHDRDH
jgi:molybdenum cofactor cytidylyltransferase